MPDGAPAIDAMVRLADEIQQLREALAGHRPTLAALVSELEESPDLAAVLRDALAVADRDRLYTPAEMAERWGANPRTIDRWCRDGRIPAARKVGSRWFIPVDAEVLPKQPIGPASSSRRARSSARLASSDEAGLRALEALRPKPRRSR